MNITKMSIGVCVNCFSPFFRDEVCASCGCEDQDTFWIDDSGDCLFRIASDVRDNEHP